MYQPQKRESKIALTLGLSALLFCANPAWAEFTLDWTADTANPVFSGTTITRNDDQGTNFIFNQTPFLYERVQEGSAFYYHMIIGDPADGFAQEVYIPQTNVNVATFGFPGGGLAFTSTSNGATGDGVDPTVSLDYGNAQNPLSPDSTFTGNSSGNPSRVQMRQLVTDGDLTVDFVKDRYAEKPTISNVIDASDLNATLIIDSTGNPLTSAATASVVTNTTELKGSDLPPDVSSPNGGPSAVRFDAATDAQNSHVTAGMYSYAPGAGPGGSSGTYTYSEGSANINPDWSSYFDHTEANPWAYPDNRPTP